MLEEIPPWGRGFAICGPFSTRCRKNFGSLTFHQVAGDFRPRRQHIPQRRRSVMAKLNRTLVLNSVTRSDYVVTARTGIGSNLVMVQALAALSQFWPEPTVPAPANPMPRRDLAMVDGDYRDRVATRAGRSARPAGCHPCDLADHSARSAAAKWLT